MKITYIITGLGLGGAEVVTCNLANQMLQRGHQVQLIYLSGGNQQVERLQRGIHCVGLEMRKSPWGLLCALRKAKLLIRDFSPDVVHAQMFHANIFTRLLRLLTPIKRVVCSEHSFYIGSKLRMQIYRYTDFLSDINTNVSKEATLKFVRQKAFGKSKSITMYNGIQCDNFICQPKQAILIRERYGILKNDILVLNAGRLTAAKNQINLLHAFAWAYKRNNKLRLLILGKGELYSILQQEISRLELQTVAFLIGAHPNMADFYGAADIFTMSSDWEGMPMAILEAMAAGCPIITTAVGGAEETVANYRWIVPIRNSSQLGECLLNMANLNKTERNAIGNNNQMASRKFDFSVVVPKWEKLYTMKNLLILADDDLLVK